MAKNDPMKIGWGIITARIIAMIIASILGYLAWLGIQDMSAHEVKLALSLLIAFLLWVFIDRTIEAAR